MKLRLSLISAATVAASWFGPVASGTSWTCQSKATCAAGTSTLVATATSGTFDDVTQCESNCALASDCTAVLFEQTGTASGDCTLYANCDVVPGSDQTHNVCTRMASTTGASVTVPGPHNASPTPHLDNTGNFLTEPAPEDSNAPAPSVTEAAGHSLPNDPRHTTASTTTTTPTTATTAGSQVPAPRHAAPAPHEGNSGTMVEPAPEDDDGPAPEVTLASHATPEDPRGQSHSSTTTVASAAMSTGDGIGISTRLPAAPAPEDANSPAPTFDGGGIDHPSPAPEDGDGPAPSVSQAPEATPPDPRHKTTTINPPDVTAAIIKNTGTAPAPQQQAPAPAEGAGNALHPAPEASDGPAPSVTMSGHQTPPDPRKHTTARVPVTTTAPRDAGKNDESSASSIPATTEETGDVTATTSDDNTLAIALGVTIPVIVVCAGIFLFIKFRTQFKGASGKSRAQNLLAATDGVDLSQIDGDYAAHAL